MKKIFKAITSAAVCGCMMLPFTAFAESSVSFTQEEINAANSNLATAVEYLSGDKLMGDFDRNNAVTLDDARKTLRFAAGLEQAPDSEFMYRCDMNGDGAVTPADARKILRVAARLENSDIAYLNAFNAMINWVKPNNPVSTRASYRNVLSKKTYDNTGLSATFKSQMNDLLKNVMISGAMTDEEKKYFASLDLGKELTSINHNSEDVYKTPEYAGREINNSKFRIEFPLGRQEKTASTLQMSSIEKIVYNANDSGIFTCEKQYMNAETKKYDTYYEKEVNAPSITIYLKQETVYDFPDDVKTLAHGSVFNVNVDTDTSFNGLEDDFKDIGDISGSLQSVDFKGSYVKVYFNGNEKSASYGKPIFIDYHLNYDINVFSHIKMYMDVLTEKIDIDDYFTFTSTFNERTQFYMIVNT